MKTLALNALEISVTNKTNRNTLTLECTFKVMISPHFHTAVRVVFAVTIKLHLRQTV